MPFRMWKEDHGKVKAVLNMVLYGAVTAVLTLTLAGALSGQSKELADRVDRNAQISRAAVETVLCVLLVDPDARTADVVASCADVNGYHYAR